MIDPRVDRPHIPGYGIPTSTEGVLPWSWAVEQLERTEIYWLATAGADGAPHLIPIWGAWVDGHWYVEMKIQASNSQINHGTMKLTASLDGHSESVEFTV